MTSTAWPTSWADKLDGLVSGCARNVPAEAESSGKNTLELHISLWSCRESNPGPTAFPQGFSVRSSLCLYSDLLVPRTSQDDDPSRCECPDESRDRTHRWIPLADARVRAEGGPGLTD